ncbi:MAG TPA: 16S rRNA (guanine(527)-N(7))-methyltransferase RsmG [Pyrinomonadaceae bacterium]|nr:16S rRNA (guanine(527)-N(7))-methyltransferase RsmG [Pyrinomonadaceae bacterium]
MNTTPQTEKFRNTLDREGGAYGVTLTAGALDRLSQYYELLNQWNWRLHLVAPCKPEEFASRHVLESLTLLKHLPADALLADVGTGGGLPAIPCLIARSELRAVLIESSQKKAVFLREALTQARVLDRASIIDQRFEDVIAPSVDFVTCRALDRFEEMLPKLFEWVPVKSTLLLFGGEAIEKQIEKLGVVRERELMPKSEGRFLFVVNKNG